MTEHYHPIRDAEIHTFERVRTSPDEAVGISWTALFYPYNTYAVVARASTREIAIQKLEELRAEAITKFEKEYQRRATVSEARRKRGKKKEAA